VLAECDRGEGGIAIEREERAIDALEVIALG
jgi:hypothetical protein